MIDPIRLHCFCYFVNKPKKPRPMKEENNCRSYNQHMPIVHKSFLMHLHYTYIQRNQEERLRELIEPTITNILLELEKMEVALPDFLSTSSDSDECGKNDKPSSLKTPYLKKIEKLLKHIQTINIAYELRFSWFCLLLDQLDISTTDRQLIMNVDIDE